MKKICAAILAAALCFGAQLCAFGEGADDALGAGAGALGSPPEISAKSAVVIDMATGRVLYQKDSGKRLAMASTTKMMTTLLALEERDIDTYFTVDPAAIKVEGSSMGLLEGDEVSLRQLCYGMILPSGNDAANITALRLGGNREEFIRLMNERAYQLSLNDTNFVTPSGLDAEGHYSSALDLAKLGRYCMQDETFRDIAKNYRAKVHFGNPPFDRWLKNHNKLLELYEYCIGVKTGFTDNAGRVLVSAAAKNGMELVCVTMNDPNDWRDHENLYEWLFSSLTVRDITPLLAAPSIPVAGIGGEVMCAVENVAVPLLPGEYEELHVTVKTKPFVYAPVERGGYAGEFIVSLNNGELLTEPFYFGENVAPLFSYTPEEGLFKKLVKYFKNK